MEGAATTERGSKGRSGKKKWGKEKRLRRVHEAFGKTEVRTGPWVLSIFPRLSMSCFSMRRSTVAAGYAFEHHLLPYADLIPTYQTERRPGIHVRSVCQAVACGEQILEIAHVVGQPSWPWPCKPPFQNPFQGRPRSGTGVLDDPSYIAKKKKIAGPSPQATLLTKRARQNWSVALVNQAPRRLLSRQFRGPWSPTPPVGLVTQGRFRYHPCPHFSFNTTRSTRAKSARVPVPGDWSRRRAISRHRSEQPGYGPAEHERDAPNAANSGPRPPQCEKKKRVVRALHRNRLEPPAADASPAIIAAKYRPPS